MSELVWWYDESENSLPMPSLGGLGGHVFEERVADEFIRDGEFMGFLPGHQDLWRYPVFGVRIIRTKSAHVATMDADRWLIVMDSPAPLGIPYVRKEAA